MIARSLITFPAQQMFIDEERNRNRASIFECGLVDIEFKQQFAVLRGIQKESEFGFGAGPPPVASIRDRMSRTKNLGAYMSEQRCSPYVQT